MIDIAVNRCLTLDILQQKQIPGSILLVDASNCYDHLAHNMMSLANQCLVVAAEIMVCLLTTIQMMVFFLHTAYSDSQTSYKGHQQVPFQGACQGNGGGPGMFLSISIILIKVMYSNGHVATIACPCNNRATSDIHWLHVCGLCRSGGCHEFTGRIIYINCTMNTSRLINMVRGPSSSWGCTRTIKVPLVSHQFHMDQWRMVIPLEWRYAAGYIYS